MTTSMRLRDLLAGVAEAPASGDIVVSGLQIDSRRVRPGNAFVALAGRRAHGITFAPAAVAQGASVILAEGPVRAAPEIDAPVVWIDGLRDCAGPLAARFHGDPSRAMTVIGVTGTNGKTSCVQMLAQALTLLGHRAATIGTLGSGMHGAIEAGERTTPDALSMQALLADFRAQGASHVAMEVSSHALDQGRVEGVAFDLAAFTNLTRDHLDYHGTMQAYGEAKARLFAWPGLKAAVVNVDDGFGRSLSERLPEGVTRLRVSVGGTQAEVTATDVEAHGDGLHFTLHTPWGETPVHSPLLGRFNVANLLLVAACLGALGEDFARVGAVLAQLQPVRGRMSRLGGEGGQPLLVVDYSHTPDALEQALNSLRGHTRGALICVFGCGGERDAGKRPHMGAIAERLADRVIVTDDNPRGEDGDVIVAQILAGMDRPEAAAVQRDRAAAIHEALRLAHADDVVLVAGKGHEDYQEVNGEKHPFDDLEVARAAMEVHAC
ncbi:UDP-N-acetylmuramoyl-L-alanyl-D-glutamate--2,6-diaminopimelate ligase [Oleiagrimonas soli]|uniref:UDP-N-acetylmuramoyl-L-alanyl-D-glutamate--2,6-diaminopimelate ligase n=1 Tax=Oleiagrimonas soli TaxID=1543381 RepID=A0A099CTS8_9GAMM|nr:UDP-N-acetylmuramoyl-L-alanyl-D-glutamate--2,6-diaminopimelate ligase [Oleiagrimonas soli]KGI77061.1 UDP-N-acetylmuramoylalanyl-D-glutamate--2,6-diaminopimelate ligase [Oleiagrimonas soli]MBB6185409.1 UDP-N-acetylmuramoyl-L-alanyl-D-glutamate--2,6-diaminopimelate ligase [Oleiagrimonas soli]